MKYTTIADHGRGEARSILECTDEGIVVLTTNAETRQPVSPSQFAGPGWDDLSTEDWLRDLELQFGSRQAAELFRLRRREGDPMSRHTSDNSGQGRVPIYPGRVEWGCDREGQFCGVCAVGFRVDYCGPWLPTKEEALEDALHWIYEHGYRHPLAAGTARFRETRIASLTVPAERAGEQLHQQELFGQAEGATGPYGSGGREDSGDDGDVSAV